jgi:predicted dinucleotide-binding enzyme
MKIAVLGRGQVGQTLGNAWSPRHEVVYVSRTPSADDERSMAETSDFGS